MHRWVFRRLNRLQAMRWLLAVKSSTLWPLMLKMVLTASVMVGLRWASYSSASSAVWYMSLFL